MKLIMASINYKNSHIGEREKFSFSKEEIGDICEKICRKKGINGCVIISTCNRTEIYLSCDENLEADADKLLIECSSVNDFNGNFLKLRDMDAVYYIIELACGLKSQIVGEGQIVAQINDALAISRERNCTNSELNTLFRIAVSAGKYTLTNAKITNIPLSSAYGVVDFLEKACNTLKNKKCVVIGNGKMGKIVQKLLLEKGCRVLVALRSYKHGYNEIIKGCGAIAYNERYGYIDGCDFVVSATKSPHYTIMYDQFSQLKKFPDIVIDLAMPRDVEPEIKTLTKCCNIDELGYESKINDEELYAVHLIVEKYAHDFIKWKNYKMSLPNISRIKNIITQRVVNGCNEEGSISGCDMEGVVSATVDKAVDILLGSMKEFVFPEKMENSRKKIEGRARL